MKLTHEDNGIRDLTEDIQAATMRFSVWFSLSMFTHQK